MPVKEEIQKVIQGWEGKPKGMMQVLWECGFIDVDNLLQYTVYEHLDEFRSTLRTHVA